jgi:phosphatidylglycerol---prolipoprotein diacylglyceryl transferase
LSIVREGIQIGPLFIHFYGVLIMIGALIGCWLASRLAENRGYNSEIVWDLLPWALIGGILGARIWHILTPPASMVKQGITTYFYLTHPLDALAIWRGGLGIPGAVMGGVLAIYFFCRVRKQSLAVWLDFIAPGLALAQAIGRWGNFVNQELYGAPSNLPWSILIAPDKRIAGFENVAYYHPLFLYECIWNLLNLGFLLWIGRRFADRLKPGDIFLSYLVFYPVGRFFFEFLRLDPSPVAGINANQTLMAVIAILSTITLIYRHRAGQQPTPEEDISQEA